VEAGPGSGKTRVIAARVDHLCVDVPAHRILVLTFSVKAAGELEARIKPRVEGVVVRTFHGFCAWLLRTRGAAIGVRPDFKIADARVQQEVLREAQRAESAAEDGAQQKRRLDDACGNEGDEDEDRGATGRSGAGLLEAVLRSKPPLPAACSGGASASAAAASESQPPRHDGAEQDEYVCRLAARYMQVLAARGMLDYDDLLVHGLQLLRHPEVGRRIAAIFVHVLVDEFQDTSAVQCDIVAAVAAAHRNAFLVGDANQCICERAQPHAPPSHASHPTHLGRSS
jgi:DNA helicase-2/ATP-dependent DNA helicase PcrA